MKPDSGAVDVNGTSLHWEAVGDGPPVVLVHAGVADARMWAAIVPALARRHRVVAYDQRGFGRSAFPPGPFSFAGDLVALLDALGLDRVALVGASFGGVVALEAAVAHPDRVRALALLAPGARDWDWSPAVEEYDAAETAAFEADELDAAVEANLRAWVDPGPGGPELRALVGEMARRSFELQPEVYEEEAPDPPAAERLGDVRAPTLVVSGGRDFEDFEEIAESLAAGIAGARREKIAGAGHLMALDSPAETLAVLEPFLDSAPG